MLSLMCILFIANISSAKEWPSSICHPKPEMKACLDGFTTTSLDLGFGNKTYCVHNEFYPLDFYPDRLDEQTTITGYDEFTDSLPITYRQILRLVCESAHWQD